MYSVILEGTNKVHVIQKGRNNTMYLSSFSLLNMCGVIAFSESACELSTPEGCSVDRTLPKKSIYTGTQCTSGIFSMCIYINFYVAVVKC